MALSKEANKWILIGCISFVVIAAIVIVIVIFVPRNNKKNPDTKQTYETEAFKHGNKPSKPKHEDEPKKPEKHVSFEEQFLQSYIENSI